MVNYYLKIEDSYLQRPKNYGSPTRVTRFKVASSMARLVKVDTIRVPFRRAQRFTNDPHLKIGLDIGCILAKL